jgi:hypothetical protein
MEFHNTEPGPEFIFSDNLPPYTKEELKPDYSSTKDAPALTFSNTLPSEVRGDSTSSQSKWPKERMHRRIIISHILSVIFAIPTITLFAIDLHAYLTQPPVNHTSPAPTGQYSNINPITILDGFGLALLALSLLYAAVYFSYPQLKNLTTLEKYIAPIFIADALLCAGIQAIADTTISMRADNSPISCQRFLYLDPNACQSWRRTIARAAGAMGVLAR